MAKRRVLLLCAQPLLGEGLETILSRLEDMELSGPWAPDAQVMDRLLKDVPDIVLVVEKEKEDQSITSLMTGILERYPDLPVVRIGLVQNVIRLYTSRTLPARSADLIETIRSLPARPLMDKTGNQA